MSRLPKARQRAPISAGITSHARESAPPSGVDRTNKSGPVYLLAKLSRTLACIEGQLSDFGNIDEDKSWIAAGKGPPPRIKRGAEYAIANVRHIASQIFDAETIADQLPSHALLTEVKVVLHLTRECIGQADVPADFALYEKERREAVDICRDAMRRAHERCSFTMQELSARVFVAARSGLPGQARPDDDPERVAFAEADLRDSAKACADFIRKNPGQKGQVIANAIGIDFDYFRGMFGRKLRPLGFYNDEDEKGYYPPPG